MVYDARVLHNVKSVDFAVPLLVQNLLCDVSINNLLDPLGSFFLRNCIFFTKSNWFKQVVILIFWKLNLECDTDDVDHSYLFCPKCSSSSKRTFFLQEIKVNWVGYFVDHFIHVEGLKLRSLIDSDFLETRPEHNNNHCSNVEDKHSQLEQEPCFCVTLPLSWDLFIFEVDWQLFLVNACIKSKRVVARFVVSIQGSDQRSNLEQSGDNLSCSHQMTDCTYRWLQDLSVQSYNDTEHVEVLEQIHQISELGCQSLTCSFQHWIDFCFVCILSIKLLCFVNVWHLYEKNGQKECKMDKRAPKRIKKCSCWVDVVLFIEFSFDSFVWVFYHIFPYQSVVFLLLNHYLIVFIS